ncbi:MAG: 4-hydroxy-tetrahydrodipicolinate synthase, partial [Methanomicrobiales archaeon HGW-Methanomicrobiales-4]
LEMTRDEEFSVISGDDGITLPILGIGGAGVISVAANIVPGPMIQMYDAVQKGDYETARKIHFELSPLFRAMFFESNPIPVKVASEMRGLAAGPVRLPLDDASAGTREKLKEVLSHYD